MLLEELNTCDYGKIKLLVGRSKHIEMRYHFLRDQVSKARLTIDHCKTELQLADILTKFLKQARFEEVKNEKHDKSELGSVLWLIHFYLRI